MNKTSTIFLLLLSSLLIFSSANAQQITGVWKGKINNQRVELKIIQKGDSLTGTSYYYGLTGNHKRYSIKGYFDAYSNSVVWWDEELISAKGANAITNFLFSVADFNCPGGGRMFLDGKASKKITPKDITGDVNLTKVDKPSYRDEWDFVLENYSIGGNDPYIIDSIGRIATVNKTTPAKPTILPNVVEEPLAKAAPVAQPKNNSNPQGKAPPVVQKPVVKNTPVAKPTPAPVVEERIVVKPPTIEELFTTRKKVFTKEIPIEGDSIELHFYDNAEVDGDSITLYLNNKMILTHLRLTGNPYILKLQVNELDEINDLVMVAENLGSIPPNTAFMIALVAGKRHEAYLESTEGSSSLIRFTKLK